MNSWIYFAAASLADLHSTFDLAHLNKVISRTAKNNAGRFIANVKTMAPGDDVLLACRGKQRHVALKATVGEPRNSYPGTTALDVLDEKLDSDAIEAIEFLYPNNLGKTVFRLEAIEPCYIDLSSHEFPMGTIQPCPEFISAPSISADSYGTHADVPSKPSQSTKFGGDENAIAVLGSVFPYIGEYILQAGLSSSLADLSEVFKCGEVVAVHRQCKLGFPDSGVAFDGSGTLDLALELKDGEIIPVEVKLGYTGLTKSSIEKILLPCSLSAHLGEKRISGKVPSALNQNFDDELRDLVQSESMQALINGRWRVVSDKWRMIVRTCVAESWDRNMPSGFSEGFERVELEKLCDVIGRDKFNTTVTQFFANRDFLELWIGK